ncbi:hypothetical protein [Polaromonas sp. SM01]|uniref:hypothetical protein n=1 Tax=Polaromonas sp. SM01 TaxID=3085630 RepID=UPI002980A87D|nr:hypothetical protein [Polaromonas sp. SM01]MDW5443184.1 hypothetical protein [Polaromonas sp. SM01]
MSLLKIIMKIKSFFGNSVNAPATQEATVLRSRDEGLACPTCETMLSMEMILDASKFWTAGAIVFHCPQCSDSVYFAPYENENEIELGRLAASPVVDTLPCFRYPYMSVHELTTRQEGTDLMISAQGKEWRIPRFGGGS